MRVVAAIFVSVLVHAVLAGALAAYLACAPTPDVRVNLDLSSVELSFAEKEDESSAVAPLPPASAPRPPRPREAEPPVLPMRTPLVAPERDAPKFPEPKEAKPEIAEASMSSPAPAVAPRQAKIDAPPRPKRNIRPDYPRGARQRGEQGDVVLEIRVSAEGAVERVEVVGSCGYPELDEAAVRAVRNARFTPAKSGRENVVSTARIKLSFKLK